MADRSKAVEIEAFLLELPTLTIGATFNQFRDKGPDDVPHAPAIRLANLLHYLEERPEADVFAVGEAAGYQGMRWSGIAFTSEFDLLERWRGGPYRRTSLRDRLWKEPSGTIVHGLLEQLGAERRVILWNIVPTHPRDDDRDLSNRHPSQVEIRQGIPYAERLIAIVQPKQLIAIGRVAERALADHKPHPVRHPAQSGATAFRAGMRALLGPAAGG